MKNAKITVQMINAKIFRLIQLTVATTLIPAKHINHIANSTICKSFLLVAGQKAYSPISLPSPSVSVDRMLIHLLISRTNREIFIFDSLMSASLISIILANFRLL